MSAIALAHGGEPPDSPDRSRSGHRPRILLVDVDRPTREICAEVLIRFGYEVVTAPDGRAAWRALKAEGYDLLVTDHRPPEVSGIGLLNQLRAARMALPVIFATAIPPTEDASGAPWPRPAATLIKPYTVVELVATVEGVLREAGNIRAQTGLAPALAT